MEATSGRATRRGLRERARGAVSGWDCCPGTGPEASSALQHSTIVVCHEGPAASTSLPDTGVLG